MSTTAFMMLIVPACFAVPAGLALGLIVEELLNGFGALISAGLAARAARGRGASPGARNDRGESGVARGRDECRRPAPRAEAPREDALGRFGLRREPVGREGRDGAALLNGAKGSPAASAPWM